ncbi:MAG: hypothetical protein LC791_12535 [Acidobacteria bacterium]|nr:hypothetical protein [Acidobacteriota bacterium]
MSQEDQRTELHSKTQQLLNGSLKHVRAAALAAALVPLAAVAVSPAVAQSQGSGGAPPPSEVPSPCDFTTSGGFVFMDFGQKANFGAHGGCKNGEFWGHINYMDHALNYHVNSLEVTGYLAPLPGSNVRDVCGVATTNAPEPQPVWFRIRLVDNGEPGRADLFGIRLSNGYVVTTRTLGAGSPRGGNVQVHDPNPSTQGPSPAPDESTMCGGLAAP